MRKSLLLILVLVLLLFQLPSAAVSSTYDWSTAYGLTEPFASDDAYPEYRRDDLLALPTVNDFAYAFAPPSPQWQVLTTGDTPAAFSQVQYELAEGVLDISGHDTVIQQIASEGQLLAGSAVQKLRPLEIIKSGGYVPMAALDAVAAQQGRTVENGTVVVDVSSGTAFKVVAPTQHTGIFQANKELQNMVAPLQDMYAVSRPQLHEIFQDFSLGGEEGETIELTRGNISGFAPGIEKNMVIPTASAQTLSQCDDYQGYRHIYGEKLVDLKFDEELLDAQLSGGATVRVKVSGGIGIQKILVNAKYTRFSGYRFALTLNQESYLLVEMEAAISEEIRIPVFGIDAGIGDVGRVTGGVFVIVGIDGALRLEICAREFTSTTVGVRGGTAAYIPTSIRPVYNQTLKGDGDVRLTGDVDGYIKFGPMLGIELFGYDLVGAGVFLGTGVEVAAENKDLDIELYGILNVYVDFLGKHFNLLNLRPTIWERKQLNTAGHLVTFMEAYVYPGRVSGTIKREVPSGPGQEDGFAPVANLPYRIWVVPGDQTFDPSNPADLNKKAISKYPASGYARTNAEGIFFQKKEEILSGGDRVYVEFQLDGKSYFSNPTEATLPFEQFTITQADYFNDFVVGQVQPIRVINWDVPADDPDNRYEWHYYENSPVLVRPMLYVTTHGTDKWVNNGGVAYARTDAYGYFDTRDVYVNDAGEVIPHWKFDLRADADAWIYFNSFRFRLILDYDGATISGEVPYSSTMSMAFSRIVREVPNSYKRFEIGGRLVDQMAYDEYIYVVNPNGTRAVSEEEFCYWAESFSTQDFHAGLVDYRYIPTSISNELWRKGTPDVKTPKKNLLPVLDANGSPTGATLFLQRVFVEWVWQAHPNPVTITSADHFSLENSGDAFQVTATGYAPFAFSLVDAPPGVQIDRDTGLLTVAEETPLATHQFTIRAEENREKYLVTLPNGVVLDQSKLLGPYEGHDPSPPADQLFTLTVKEAVITPEPSPEPTPTTRVAPKIDAARHGYAFVLHEGERDLSVQVTAAGSTPLTWSLAPVDRYQFPASAVIDSKSGLLTIGTNIAAGSYRFIIQVQNDVGQDTRICNLEVRSAPVIEEEIHAYQFKILKRKEDITIPIYATGSRPITWSLEPTGRMPLTDTLAIDPQTGVLTIASNTTTGFHYFTIRAANDVGFDTQDCILEIWGVVVNPFLRQQDDTSQSLSALNETHYLSSFSGLHKDFTSGSPLLDHEYFSADTQFAVDPTELQLNPPNILTLRYDDPNDVYTHDRWTKNGATFVRWQSFPGVLQRFNHMTDHYWSAGTGTMLLDASPRCDNYHYQAPAAPSLGMEEIKQFYQDRILAYQNEDIFLGERFDHSDLLAQAYFSSRSRTSPVTYLDYGTIIAQINRLQGGQHEVALDQHSGTLVSGKFFAALEDYQQARLTIRQEGAAVTFIGQDITHAADYEVYDFGYQVGAIHEKDMARQLSAGEQHFICSFADYPAFPGLATFTITTGFVQDTEVNVYQYAAADKQFSLIAEAVSVGKQGAVTYRNQSMSELLITTQTLQGAAVSDMVGLQNFPHQTVRWYWFVGLGILLLAGGGTVIWLLLLRKKRVPISVEKP